MYPPPLVPTVKMWFEKVWNSQTASISCEIPLRTLLILQLSGSRSNVCTGDLG